MSQLPWIDLAIIGGALLLGSKGYFSGLGRELASLVGLMGGLALSTRVARPMTEMLLERSPLPLNPGLIQLLVFALVLAAFWGGVTLLQRKIEQARPAEPERFSRFLGWAVATLKYLLVAGIALVMLSSAPTLRKRLDGPLSRSILAKPLKQIGSQIVRLPRGAPLRLQTSPR